MDTNAYERPLILAPVGGAEQLKAALRTGADAVGAGQHRGDQGAGVFGQLDAQRTAVGGVGHAAASHGCVQPGQVIVQGQHPAARRTDAALQQPASLPAAHQTCCRQRPQASDERPIGLLRGRGALGRFGVRRPFDKLRDRRG